MLDFAAPFLATDRRQLDSLGPVPVAHVEAVIFDRVDLSGEKWELVWKNIHHACAAYRPANVVFHFPVNESDYVEDAEVRNRLQESYLRISDLGMAGMVVHSNRIKPISAWQGYADLAGERERVVCILDDIIADRERPDAWIGLENMPVMDNDGIEIDPLFCFPADFEACRRSRVSITWDFCHFTNSLANMAAVHRGAHRQCHYPNIANCELDDVKTLVDKVAHWHFSAFRGVSNPDTGERCVEGVLPSESTLCETTYVDCVKLLTNCWKEGQSVTLEIRETNYLQRQNILLMIEWLESHLLRTGPKTEAR